MMHVVRGVGWLRWLGCGMELGWSEVMRGGAGAGVSDKLDQVRVDDTHNLTTHMHEGCMLDEVLCMDGGVDDGWVGGMDGLDGGWMGLMGWW